MAAPKGYSAIGRKYLPSEKAEAMREAKRARKVYGDKYVVRPIKSRNVVLYYQIYWKRGR